MRENATLTTLFLHVACWALFISYELTFFYLFGNILGSPWVHVLFYAVNILFFYTHIPVLNILFYHRRGWLKAPLLFLLLVCVYLGVKFAASYYLEDPPLTLTMHLQEWKKFISGALYRGLYFSVLAVFYWSATHVSGFRRNAAAAEARLAQVHNALLQQQISPHMLFNTLNFIYSKVHDSSAEAARCVLLLSDILRFSLEGPGGDGKILLSDEAEQVRNLVSINRYRFDDRPFTFELTGDAGEKRIIPLILLTLTENLFKHADLRKPVILRLEINDKGELTYFSRNAKKVRPDTATTGKGLENIRVRLDHAYAGRYRLDINGSDTDFELKLYLLL